MPANRIVVVLLFVFGLGAAVLPAAANLDWTSTAGILGGLGAVCVAGVTFLLGWQRWEANESNERRDSLLAIATGQEFETDSPKAEGFEPPPDAA